MGIMTKGERPERAYKKRLEESETEGRLNNDRVDNPRRVCPTMGIDVARDRATAASEKTEESPIERGEFPGSSGELAGPAARTSMERGESGVKTASVIAGFAKGKKQRLQSQGANTSIFDRARKLQVHPMGARTEKP